MVALPEAGFNVCTLANNHTMDWGLDAVVECRERLEALGIAVCGAGKNIAEARKAAIVEKKGIKVAFLGYNSVGPNWSLAEENKPGCAMVRAHTLYEPYDYQPGTKELRVVTRPYHEDLVAMVEDIRKAKEHADLVVMTDHWGVHHERAAIPDYEFEVGHAAIDAGADLVLGTSTHILKGVEVYKGKVILHSLANFALETRHIAEQEGDRVLTLRSLLNMREKATGRRDPDSSKSIIVKCLLSKEKVERVSFVPVMLDSDWASPELLLSDDPRAQEVFTYMEAITREADLSTLFFRDGDELTVGS
jgi:poly-gamma-glutamate synthesis protein (capsule biosynthesis protein)